MGQKRLKLAKGLGEMKESSASFKYMVSRIDTTPYAVNFSELEQEYEENNQDFDPGDDGFEVNKIEDNIVYEELMVLILCNLEPREKLVFLYQILRDGGYQIDHASFARTLNLSRRQYMRVLEDVRLKSSLYITGYHRMCKTDESHK